MQHSKACYEKGESMWKLNIDSNKVACKIASNENKIVSRFRGRIDFIENQLEFKKKILLED